MPAPTIVTEGSWAGTQYEFPTGNNNGVIISWYNFSQDFPTFIGMGGQAAVRIGPEYFDTVDSFNGMAFYFLDEVAMIAANDGSASATPMFGVTDTGAVGTGGVWIFEGLDQVNPLGAVGFSRVSQTIPNPLTFDFDIGPGTTGQGTGTSTADQLIIAHVQSGGNTAASQDTISGLTSFASSNEQRSLHTGPSLGNGATYTLENLDPVGGTGSSSRAKTILAAGVNGIPGPPAPALFRRRGFRQYAY